MAGTSSYSNDSTLYLYTSLTAGSSHIITATSRLETILKANKIPFRALDCATDEKARMLWGRRSRGKKLPGLVKFGNIIGDLEQIEEWNEYGELKDQINSSHEFGNLSVTPTPEQPPSQPQKSDPPTRDPSETRHISISEPKSQKEVSENNPASNLKSSESPMTMAMRQVGAEAAAKAGQKKTTSSTSPKAASAPVQESSATAKNPTVAATKLQAEAEEPSTAAEASAAKTPAQLASEGVKTTSMHEINEPEATSRSSISGEPTPSSTEEQVLDLRRHSSIAKSKSRLSESMSANKGGVVEDNKSSVVEGKSDSSEIAEQTDQKQQQEEKRSVQHRGSNVEEASKHEIRAIEEKNTIKEEDEEETSTSKTAVDASTENTKPQEKDAKDIEATEVSVGD